MIIAPIKTYDLIVRPNGYESKWEVVDGYDLEPVGFYNTFKSACNFAIEMARKSAYLVGYTCGDYMPIHTLADYTIKIQKGE